MTKEEVIQNFKSKKMTAVEAAKAAGVSRYTVYGWARGSKKAKRKVTRAKTERSVEIAPAHENVELRTLQAENVRLKALVGDLYLKINFLGGASSVTRFLRTEQ